METKVALRIVPGSPSWPAELETIDAPPEALWLRGRADILARRPRIAIVGSRAPTPYGEAQAERFASTLARAGVVIVSGMARGVDHVAHRSTLACGGATIAVLGSGVDRPWPSGDLTDALAEQGLLISEFLPGEPPRPYHFPLRNRLISGLSAGVLVVEAAHASGSLITARWAVDQGRNVYALPGRVDHPMSRGTHRLLREGATLVESPEEILIELFGTEFVPRTVRESAPRLTPEANRTLAALYGETRNAEEIASALGRPLTTVLVQLVELELAGIVVRGPGGLYRMGAPSA
ncbi:MAG: DNA-processing protein DprA [Planctomycetota bacterium]